MIWAKLAPLFRYRLGKPSKQYAPWYEPVLHTARVAVSIITLLKEQSRVARLSFIDVVKRLSEFKKDNPAYISSDPTAVERYVVVHGQIILQLFEEYPDVSIRKCAFLTGLANKMEERRHTKWLVKKKKDVRKTEQNLNPRANAAPLVSTRKAMQATTTRLINKIWGEYYSNYSPEDSKEETMGEVKEEEEESEEQEENEEDDVEEDELILEEKQKSGSAPKHIKSGFTKEEIRWDGEPVNERSSRGVLYKKAIVCGEVITVGAAVLVEVENDETENLPVIYFVEYMFESSDGSKMFHGRVMQRGSNTVLGNAANEREVFLTNECLDCGLEDIKHTVVVDIRLMPWGYQHRKDNANADKMDKARAEERKKKGLPTEYYCKSLYWPEKGAFFTLPVDTMALGSGSCQACEIKEAEKANEMFKLNSSKTSFMYRGAEYFIHDFVYVSPYLFEDNRVESGNLKGGRNIGLRPYIICQILEVVVSKKSPDAQANSTQVKVRRFYRPEDISSEKAYSSDIREV